MKNHFIVSLKWTHKNDKWITFWRGNSSGYCWFKEWAGLYNINEIREWIDKDYEKPINQEEIERYWIEIEYEGIKRYVLPNTDEVLEALGIGRRHLIKKYKSNQ